MVLARLRVNPLDPADPISWRDAAVVAAIAAFAVWILQFLANASLGQVRADPWAFIFDAVKTYATTWAGNFIALTGLGRLTGSREKPPEPT